VPLGPGALALSVRGDSPRSPARRYGEALYGATVRNVVHNVTHGGDVRQKIIEYQYIMSIYSLLKKQGSPPAP
jgi:hypothetical protein